MTSSLMRASNIDEWATLSNKYMQNANLEPAVLELMEQVRIRLTNVMTGAVPTINAEPVVVTSGQSQQFAQIAVGSTSPTQMITLTNRGQAGIALQSGFPSTFGPFSVASNSCTGLIAAGASCSIGVTFTPTSATRSTGSLTLGYVGYAQTTYYPLSGSGSSTSPSPFSLHILPEAVAGQYYPTLNLGTVSAGQTTAPQTVTLTNTGSAAISFIAGYPQVSLPFSIASTTCGTSIAAGASCKVSFVFTPLSGNSSRTWNGFVYFGFITGGFQYVNLQATDVGSTISNFLTSPPVEFLGNSLSFGVLNPGQTSGALSVSITNNSTTAQFFDSGYPKINGTNFRITSPSCGASIAPNSTCTISVTFNPTLIGPAYDTLFLFLNNSKTTVQLQGVGSGTALSVSTLPNSLDFDTVTPSCSIAATKSTISLGDSTILTAVCNTVPSSYTWSDGTGVLGTYAATNSAISVSPNTTKTFTVAGANSTGKGNTASSTVTVNAATTNAPKLVNLSTRAMVLNGDSAMIGGFVVQGDAPQTVLIRAVGPNLANYGVTGVLANPKLQLYSGQTVIASNDDWGTATNAAAITATGLAPVSPLESAILITLQPGAYTAVVSGADGGSGVGIIEVFAQ